MAFKVASMVFAVALVVVAFADAAPDASASVAEADFDATEAVRSYGYKKEKCYYNYQKCCYKTYKVEKWCDDCKDVYVCKKKKDYYGYRASELDEDAESMESSIKSGYSSYGKRDYNYGKKDYYNGKKDYGYKKNCYKKVCKKYDW